MKSFRSSLALACVLLSACATVATGPPTVNVTGNWGGSFYHPVGVSAMTMSLRQEGNTVTGEMFISGNPQASGPISGTVSGNVFTYTYANISGGADLVVTDNEMTGTTRAGNQLRARRQ